MNFFEITLNSLILIFTFDLDLYHIIFLSLKVSLSALLISSTFALILGYILAINNFYFKGSIIVILCFFSSNPLTILVSSKLLISDLIKYLFLFIAMKMLHLHNF